MQVSKTKIMAHIETSRQSPVSCAGKDVQVLQEAESEKYLGRKPSIDEYHNTELDNRLASGWGVFSLNIVPTVGVLTWT